MTQGDTRRHKERGGREPTAGVLYLITHHRACWFVSPPLCSTRFSSVILFTLTTSPNAPLPSCDNSAKSALYRL